MVAVHSESPLDIIGYQYLTVHGILREEIKAEKIKGYPCEVPIVELRMLGVRTDYQRKGIGQDLFFAALRATIDAYNAVGVYGVKFQSLPGSLTFYTETLALSPMTPTGSTFILDVPYIKRILSQLSNPIISSIVRM
jgi:hypothetical protein